MARQRIINYHTSGTTAPSSSDIYYGELVVSHNSIGNTKIYTKVTNPSGDTESGKIATFIDEPQIDEKISNSVNELTGIVHSSRISQSYNNRYTSNNSNNCHSSMWKHCYY